MQAVSDQEVTPAGSGRPAATRSRRSRAIVTDGWGWLAVLLYTGAAVLYFSHVMAHMNSWCACDGGGDPTQWMWMMEWLPYSVSHGLNPVLSHVMWVPQGVDLAAGTSAPSAAVVGLPFTLLFGPLVAYNVVSLGSFVAAGWTAFRLCRYLTGSPWASIVAGYLYGFSAFAIGQEQGHLFLQGAMFVPPWIVLVVLRLIRGEISRRRAVIELVILILVEFGMSLEVLFTSTLTLAIAYGVAYVVAPQLRARLRDAAGWIVLAFLIVGAIGSYYIYELFQVPSYSKGWAVAYPADLLSYVFPTPAFRIGANKFAALAAAFSGNGSEQDNYLGVPLLLVLIVWMARTWRSRATKVVAIPMLVAAVASLGDSLTVDGKSTIWMPFRLVSNLPFFDLILPSRIGVDVSLGAAVGAALWLSGSGVPRFVHAGAGSDLSTGETGPPPTHPRSRQLPGRLLRERGLVWRCVVALAILAFLYPNLGNTAREAPIGVPRFFTTHLYKRYLHRGEVVVPLPYGDVSQSLLWQADTHMYFRLASGYFGYGPKSYQTDPVVTALQAGTPEPGAAADFRHFVAAHGVSAVIVLDGNDAAWLPVLARDGFRESADAGGIEVLRRR